ncbi:Fic family protein [Prosthecobacter vanneervenii]|uniref:Fic family protein n=1 Tax=Prosthecobacter vanneervenii TaxID=48466 RepID=A0A7W7YBV4_9BACT|nr:Fic family protein [Prosthecobacter vanneervenii]MBB5033000.1 Fic family protein [Prosthecobacter vanneervenii]
MQTEIQTLEALRDDWRALQPLTAENEARLWKKLRLEWNYHSNHIEGNTLTYGETELLLLHDRTHGNHSHREYLEMKAHDVGIEHVRTLAADKDRLISEGDIRDLNRIILKEPFWKQATTANGQTTRKEIIPGEYKTTPNSVLQATGEILSFASVEETPARMSDLVAWLRAELTSPTLPVAACIAKLHHDFIIIHPFEDGNGRVARLLVNYVLMRGGWLPLIVHTEEKEDYLTALRLADAGELSALMTYLQRRLEWSMQIGIKAAKGESIEEPSDLEKEVAIFVRNQQESKDKVVFRSQEVLRQLFDLGLREFVERVETKLSKLVPLFRDHRVTIQPHLPAAQGNPVKALELMIQATEHVSSFSMQHVFLRYLTKAPQPFNVSVTATMTFDDSQYALNLAGQDLIRRRYNKPVLPDEAETLANKALAHAFAEIKKLSGSTE